MVEGKSVFILLFVFLIMLLGVFDKKCLSFVTFIVIFYYDLKFLDEELLKLTFEGVEMIGEYWILGNCY